ncbi:MAG: 16S rRNA (guanine(966)-N(2))-methyltransferase RsmD [Isosphaeraceae bacterium]|nr:16S rRNA (guanine(966)-N(2))-methyltransferase RsmD [Isosphaeraceae bacterium]
MVLRRVESRRRCVGGSVEMRIIGGESRGRRIEAPDDDQTRPTSDLVREAIFNILGDRIVQAQVFDLYAGSGALGLEALSRGAARAVFVEIQRRNVALIHRNVQSLGYEDVSKVSLADAHRFGRSFEPEPDRPCVVFLDPPYVEFLRHADKVSDLLEKLTAKCPSGSTLVVESGKHWDDGLLPERDRWELRRYGGTVVAFRFIDREESCSEAVVERPAAETSEAVDE